MLLGPQIKFWRDRMESADIADIYYPAFLSNGERTAEYPDLKPGEKVRLRFINASASTYFWMDFGSGNPIVVSSDGVDVQAVAKDRFLFAIAETYDVIVTIPNGQLEIIATAQDGSGHTTIHLGSGQPYPAKIIDRPDKIEMMQQMSKMDMKMGGTGNDRKQKEKHSRSLDAKDGMKMEMKAGEMKMNQEQMPKMNMPMHNKSEMMQKRQR